MAAVTREQETCDVCGTDVVMMAFKNTGVCSEKCRKIRDKDTSTAGDSFSKAPKPKEAS